MSESQNPEEQAKKKVAKRVITAKHQYFVPSYNITVEAENAEEAAQLAKKAVVAEEEGDAK